MLDMLIAPHSSVSKIGPSPPHNPLLNPAPNHRIRNPNPEPPTLNPGSHKTRFHSPNPHPGHSICALSGPNPHPGHPICALSGPNPHPGHRFYLVCPNTFYIRKYKRGDKAACEASRAPFPNIHTCICTYCRFPNPDLSALPALTLTQRSQFSYSHSFLTLTRTLISSATATCP